MSKTTEREYTPRRLAGIKLSYQYLASLLALKVGSIQFVEINNNSGIMKLFHNDAESGTIFELAEGQTVPETHLKTSRLVASWVETLLRMGYTVTPPKEK